MTRYEPPKISYHVTQRVLQKIVKKKTNLENCSTFFYSFSVGRGRSRISQTEVPTAERGCINLLLGKMFAKNCMKMKLDIGDGVEELRAFYPPIVGFDVGVSGLLDITEGPKI